MQTIKFKAWSKNLKKMYEVLKIDFVYNTVVCAGKEINETYTFKFSEVVLIRFTGLYDKTGREIYEGDIVATENTANKDLDLWTEKEWGYATVLIDSYGIRIKENDDYFWNWRNDEDVHSIQFIKVVGNIYENPNMLD